MKKLINMFFVYSFNGNSATNFCIKSHNKNKEVTNVNITFIHTLLQNLV